jgi:hypothetical protein
LNPREMKLIGVLSIAHGAAIPRTAAPIAPT